MNLLSTSLRGKCPKEYAFGEDFSDHMFTQHYSTKDKWSQGEIAPYKAFSLDPAAAVFHYGQEIFEGLKAYGKKDGSINLFRPLENCKRFNRSALHMAMPTMDENYHLQAIKNLVAIDRAWIPQVKGGSLYIRPAMIATDKKLGVRSSENFTHFIITGPAGSYFKEGFTPISVYIADKHRRAVVGGVGEAKTGGNYAASFSVSEEASKKGYSQVLWLDAIEGRYIEEVGAMNICFVYENNHIKTPQLTGSILPGITRDSVLKLAPELGYTISEERLDVEMILSDILSGKITEVFGCGTAAVISPVGNLCWKGKDYKVNGEKLGEVSQHLYDELTGIQYGTREDKFNWIETLD